jgi:hypothetical protein
MPTVKNTATAKPATPVKPTPVTATVKKSEAEVAPVESSNTSALAKQAKAVKLPAWLAQTQMPVVAEKDFGGFVGFASSQSNKWNEQQQAGLEDGQPYVYTDQRYIIADPLEFFLLAGESFQTLMVGKEGKFQWASRDLEEEGPTVGSNRPEPHYVCCLIVKAEGQLIPIKGDFRGTKSGGIEGAIRAIEAAATPDWLKLSDGHKVTAAFPHAFGRVFHSCNTTYKVAKTSGNPYYKANCVSKPAGLGQMQELVDALANEDFSKKLNECKSNYDQRIQFLDDVIAGKVVK